MKPIPRLKARVLRPPSFFANEEVRSRINLLLACNYCGKPTVSWEIDSDGCCQTCRMKGYGLVAYLLAHGSSKWRWWEKKLKLKQSVIETGRAITGRVSK